MRARKSERGGVVTPRVVQRRAWSVAACLWGMVVAGSLGGCSAANLETRWTQDRGGVLCDARQDRVSGVCGKLLRAWLDYELTIEVLDSNALDAHIWPKGSVYLTRGLIDNMDDEELAAAVAHEVGHLLNDQSGQALASLAGQTIVCNEESYADLLGCRLLERQGIDGRAMIRLLQKVERCEQLSASRRVQMAKRIDLLNEVYSYETQQDR